MTVVLRVQPTTAANLQPLLSLAGQYGLKFRTYSRATLFYVGEQKVTQEPGVWYSAPAAVPALAASFIAQARQLSIVLGAFLNRQNTIPYPDLY